MAAVLDDGQVAAFRRDGCLMAPSAVDPRLLAQLRAELDGWVAESRHHDGPFGETEDGMARFDVERGHTEERPRLRRVNNPGEISDAYEEASFAARMADMVADLIGPDVKFHHAKINSKLPGTDSRVGFHQDFSYTPHTNDDIVTALLLLDDMTAENGPLTIVPGSHREGQFSLWHDGAFTGQVAADVVERMRGRMVTLTGRAGDVCLMHTSLLHGSEPNRSTGRRALYISVYTAADAFPLCGSPLPNRFEGRIVRGCASGTARLVERRVELPAASHRGSFFNLAGQGTNAA